MFPLEYCKKKKKGIIGPAWARQRSCLFRFDTFNGVIGNLWKVFSIDVEEIIYITSIPHYCIYDYYIDTFSILFGVDLNSVRRFVGVKKKKEKMKTKKKRRGRRRRKRRGW